METPFRLPQASIINSITEIRSQFVELEALLPNKVRSRILKGQRWAKEFFSAGLWDAGPQDNLVEALHWGITCTADSLSIRPKMKQVVRRLKLIQPAPSPGTASC